MESSTLAPPKEKGFTVIEAASELVYSPFYVQQMLHKGTLKRRKVDGKTLIYRSDNEERWAAREQYKKAREQKPTT